MRQVHSEPSEVNGGRGYMDGVLRYTLNPEYGVTMPQHLYNTKIALRVRSFYFFIGP